MPLYSPGTVVCFDLQVDTVHPQHEVSHHVKEAKLLHRIKKEKPAGLTSLEQSLPGRGHSMFTPINVICFLTSISLLQSCCIILDLVHL